MIQSLNDLIGRLAQAGQTRQDLRDLVGFETAADELRPVQLAIRLEERKIFFLSILQRGCGESYRHIVMARCHSGFIGESNRQIK